MGQSSLGGDLFFIIYRETNGVVPLLDHRPRLRWMNWQAWSRPAIASKTALSVPRAGPGRPIMRCVPGWFRRLIERKIKRRETARFYHYKRHKLLASLRVKERN